MVHVLFLKLIVAAQFEQLLTHYCSHTCSAISSDVINASR